MSELVNDIQAKIREMLDSEGISVKSISAERQVPYTTVRDNLHMPGRLNVLWLDWYASLFGTTTDYLLSRDQPNKEVGEKFRLARENAGLSLAEASSLLDTTEYALKSIEAGEMEPFLSTFQKAVEVYQVPPEYILATGQGADEESIASVLRDINFLLTCQEIQKRPDLKKLISMLRPLSDDDLVRLSRVIEPILRECFRGRRLSG